ncbi:MAG TPA: hypothetical protein VKE42_02085, partial [Candidatus Cybelea sp.]|nr:hypothetical protein [Candidatus Cybelea sp.]
MPERCLKPCSYPGCGALTLHVRCDRHRQGEANAHRPSAVRRGYDYRWQQYTRWFKAQEHCPICGRNHAFCELCQKESRYVLTHTVDHIVPWRGD